MYPISSYWIGSGLPHISHCCSLGWLRVVSGVPLLLNVVVLWNFRYSIPHSLGWLCIISGIPLPFPWTAPQHLGCPTADYGMALCHPRCITAANWVASVSSQVTHYHLLKWLCIVYGVSLPQMGWLCIIIGVPLQLTKVASQHTKWLLAQCRGSVSFHMFDFKSRGLIYIASHVSLLFTRVSLCHSRCPTAANWSVYESFQVCHLCLLKFLSVILYLSLILARVALCCPRHFTTAPWGRCVLFQVYHYFASGGFASFQLPQFCLLGWLYFIILSQCHSLGLLCVISGVPLQVLCHFRVSGILMQLIWVTLHYFRCSTVANWNRSVLLQMSYCCWLDWVNVISSVSLPVT